MIDTSFYNVKVQLSFDDDPLEQILLSTERSASFNSLESEFEVSGWTDAAIDNKIYFNIERLSFGCIDDLVNGIGLAVIESSFPLTDFTTRMISRYVCENNKLFRLVDGDSGLVEIKFKDFRIEDVYDS